MSRASHVHHVPHVGLPQIDPVAEREPDEADGQLPAGGRQRDPTPRGAVQR